MEYVRKEEKDKGDVRGVLSKIAVAGGMDIETSKKPGSVMSFAAENGRT